MFFAIIALVQVSWQGVSHGYKNFCIVFDVFKYLGIIISIYGRPLPIKRYTCEVNSRHKREWFIVFRNGPRLCRYVTGQNKNNSLKFKMIHIVVN